MPRLLPARETLSLLQLLGVPSTWPSAPHSMVLLPLCYCILYLPTSLSTLGAASCQSPAQKSCPAKAGRAKLASCPNASLSSHCSPSQTPQGSTKGESGGDLLLIFASNCTLPIHSLSKVDTSSRKPFEVTQTVRFVPNLNASPHSMKLSALSLLCLTPNPWDSLHLAESRLWGPI